MNQITHKQAMKWIDRRLDGRLTDKQTSSLEEHLRSCDACSAYAADMALLPSYLQKEFHERWDEQPGPSQKVMQHIAPRARRIPLTNRVSSGFKLLIGATALIALGFAISFFISQLRNISPIAVGTEIVKTASRAEDRLLVFASDQNGNSDIYTMHADGSGLTNLTHDPAYDGNPVWSPDGRQIAFESDRSGISQIYLMDADGSNVIQLTTDEVAHYLPVNVDGVTNPWSPDGSKILILQDQPGEQVWTLISQDIKEGNKIPLVTGQLYANGISWSPDGKYIGYLLDASPDSPPLDPDIHITDINGTNSWDLKEVVPHTERLDSRYRWSADGGSVIFTTVQSDPSHSTMATIVYEYKLESDTLLHKDSLKDMGDWEESQHLVTEFRSFGRSGLISVWQHPDGKGTRLDVDAQCLELNLRRSPLGNFAVAAYCPGNQFKLYWANSDGSTIKPLLEAETSVNETKGSPANIVWSPDDQYIALNIESSDKTNLYVVDVKKALADPSSQPIQVPAGSGELYGIPSWQPVSNNKVVETKPTPPATPRPSSETSDRLLAFTSEQNGNSDIYTMHADGSGLTNLTNNPAYDAYPFWSPDGKQIAFESDRSGSMQIYLMDASGSNVIQLTNEQGDSHFDSNGPTPWSPDGRKLVFLQRPDKEEKYKLYSLDIEGKNKTTLTNEAGEYLSPSWSPDGGHISYSEWQGGRTIKQVFVVDDQGNHLIGITDSLPRGENFSFGDYYWSPDGKSIFFTADTNKSQQAISTVYKASLEGTLTVIARLEGRAIDWWNGTALQLSEAPVLTWLRSDGSQSTLDLCSSMDRVLAISYKRSESGNLAFGSNCSATGWTLYWANPDGTLTAKLLESRISVRNNSLFNLAWSPDDQFLTFTAMDTNSSNVTQTLYVLDVTEARKNPSMQPLRMINSYGSSWQPDSNNKVVEQKPTPEPTQAAALEKLPSIGTDKTNGEWIAFIAASEEVQSPENSKSDLYLIHPDGSGLVKLTDFPSDRFDLHWSPDGQHLLFLRKNPIINKIDIGRIYAGVPTGSGSDVTRPFTDPDHYGYSWSPNSDKIVLADASRGNYDIYTVYADGRNDPKLTQLTNDPAQDVGFAWSPDGSQIAFQRKAGGKLSIMVMNADGSDQHEVARGSGEVKLLWSQDGKFIYAASTRDNRLECEGCAAQPAIYRIDLDGPSVHQVYYEQDTSKFAGWDLYEASQNRLYFMRLDTNMDSLGTWGTWMYADGDSIHVLDEMDPHQTCKTTTGNILNEHISPNERFSIVSDSCAGGFDLYLADHQSETPGQRLIHLLRLPSSTSGQGRNGSYLPIAWSPDGRRIIYDNGNGAIYLLNVEKTLHDPAAEPLLLWQSEDNYLSFLDIAWQPAP